MTNPNMNILLTQRRWPYGEQANNPIALLDIAPVARRNGAVDCFWMGSVPAGNRYTVVGLSVLMDYQGVWDDIRTLIHNHPNAAVVVGGKWVQGLSPCEVSRVVEYGATPWRKSGEEYFGSETSMNQPPWDARDLKSLSVKNGAVMSSRGCPFNCAFCNNTEQRIHRFSAQRTVTNISLLFTRGVKKIFFVDDVFTTNAQHMRDIVVEAEKRSIPLVGRNTFFTHVHAVNADRLQAMTALNPSSVQIGIESGDDRMLDTMRKGFTSQAAYQALSTLSKSVRGVTGLFMIGFPGENATSLRNTVEFVEQTAPFLSHIWISYYQPVPGTDGYEMAKKRGRILQTGSQNTKVAYVDDFLTPAVLSKAKAAISRAWKKGRRA